MPQRAGFGLLVLAALSLTACTALPIGGSSATTPVDPSPPPPAYAGTITCVGSSVLAPLLGEDAAAFEHAYPLAHILVITDTSQAGLSAVQDGGADVGLSDVPVQTFAGLNVAVLRDHPLAGTLFALVAHPGIGLSGLSRDQVRALYGGTLRDWRDAGGVAQAVTVVSRPKGSGTRALFREFVLEDAAEDDDAATPAETNQDALIMVEQTEGAVAYVALPDPAAPVQILALDGELPSPAGVQQGRYRFWGVAHAYTKGPAGGLTGAFLTFLLTPEVQTGVFQAHGFLPAAAIPPQGNR